MSIWKNYIDKFNSGDTDFLENFDDDIDSFIDLIEKKGLLSHLEITNFLDTETENKLLLVFSKSHKLKFIDYVLNNLNDVELINGVFYLFCNPEELSELFSESRNSLSRNTVKDTLSGEHNTDWFDNTTEDVYNDVIEELDKNNLQEFYKIVVHHTKDLKIEPYTELLELIADSQGHSDFVTIDSQNVQRIVDDKESFDEILDNELTELKSNLSSLHWSSYNNAYGDELYDDVWDSLDEFFVVDQKQWVSVPFYKKTVEKLKIPIRNFSEIITEFIDSNVGTSYPESIRDYGDFISILRQNLDNSADWLKVYPPDYPSSVKVDRNINDNFSDYIY